MQYYESILDAIGNTPLIKLNRLSKGLKPLILAKVEYLNPGLSVKDRIGIAMVEDAEKQEKLKLGGTIIEGTSGNTGMGLVIAAAVKGYRCIVTIPDKMSQEKIDALRALGAEVVVTPTAVPHEDPRSYHAVARRLNEDIPNSCFPNQYDNEYNWKSHYESTGPEIWEQTEGKITHFVCGMGTCGTITGTGRYLKEKNPNIKIIGIDPEGSIYHDLFHTGKMPETVPYKVEGIGQDEPPGNMDLDIVDDIVQVSDKDSFIMTRKISKLEGIFVGGSSGTAVYGALKVAETLSENDVLVVILPDSGVRYLSKIYDDNWMRDNQYLETQIDVTAGEILKRKRAKTSHVVYLTPDTTLSEAVEEIRKNDISQVPIIDNGEVLGSLNEHNILKILLENPDMKDRPVLEFMNPPFPAVAEDVSMEQMTRYFVDGVAQAILIQKENGEYGIITRTDLISMLTNIGDGN